MKFLASIAPRQRSLICLKNTAAAAAWTFTRKPSWRAFCRPTRTGTSHAPESVRDLHARPDPAAVLAQCKVTDVAMESTGVYWKPVWNVLEGYFDVLLLAKPRTGEGAAGP